MNKLRTFESILNATNSNQAHVIEKLKALLLELKRELDENQYKQYRKRIDLLQATSSRVKLNLSSDFDGNTTDTGDKIVQAAINLKKNAYITQSLLQEDAQALPKLHSQLNNNDKKMKEINSTLKMHNEKSWETTWLLWISAFIVILTFPVVFMMIKLF